MGESNPMISECELTDLIRGCSDEQFNRDHLFQNTPWYFERDDAPCTYDRFRSNIGSVFGIKPSEVALVGSGYFGRSLSPSKPFKEYRPRSDLDVVIVSEYYFEKIWIDLLQAYYAGYTQSLENYSNTIFKRFVSFDNKITISSKWLLDIVKLNNDVNFVATSRLRLKNKMKFRVYRNWDDVIAYQNWSLSILRKKIK